MATGNASMAPGSQIGRPRSEPRWLLIAVAACLVLIALAVVEVTMSGPAGASSAAKSAPEPTCPPDCGLVSAGDPLLVRFMTNPGRGWDALPDTSVEAYTHQLKRLLSNGV